MQNILDVKKNLDVKGKQYQYFCLETAAKKLNRNISRLPFSLKILLENLLRFQDGETVKLADIEAVIDSLKDESKRLEISFSPARVLMQDFTGVPAVVDLAAMRDAIAKKGGKVQGKRNAESGHLKRIAQLPNKRNSGSKWITNGVVSKTIKFNEFKPGHMTAVHFQVQGCGTS